MTQVQRFAAGRSEFVQKNGEFDQKRWTFCAPATTCSASFSPGACFATSGGIASVGVSRFESGVLIEERAGTLLIDEGVEQGIPASEIVR